MNAAPEAAQASSATRPQGPAEELVAVMTAAIAAASGASPSAFQITSISPYGMDSGFNTPVWGRIERFTRT